MAHALHRQVAEWLTREALNRKLSTSSEELRQKQQLLHNELVQVQRKLTHLLTAIEEGGCLTRLDATLCLNKPRTTGLFEQNVEA